MAADVKDTPIGTRITVAQILVDLGYIKTQIDKLASFDDRLKKVERVIWLLSGAVGSAMIVLAPVLGDIIKIKWLGLP